MLVADLAVEIASGFSPRARNMRSGRRSCADDVDDTSAASGTEALASTTSPSVETERSREVRALEKDHTGVGERKEGPELAHCELEDVCIRLHRATLNMLLIDTALSLSLSLSLPPSLSRAPRVVLPDRALCFPTFCHLL